LRMSISHLVGRTDGVHDARGGEEKQLDEGVDDTFV